MTLSISSKPFIYQFINGRVAIKKMKQGKAAGVDEVTVEMIMAVGLIGLQWLYKLFRVILKQRIVRKNWGRRISFFREQAY